MQLELSFPFVLSPLFNALMKCFDFAPPILIPVSALRMLVRSFLLLHTRHNISNDSELFAVLCC
jgi:hypothetical protein